MINKKETSKTLIRKSLKIISSVASPLPKQEITEALHSEFILNLNGGEDRSDFDLEVNLF